MAIQHPISPPSVGRLPEIRHSRNRVSDFHRRDVDDCKRVAAHNMERCDTGRSAQALAGFPSRLGFVFAATPEWSLKGAARGLGSEIQAN
jgi:hypothetical protein